MQTPQNPTPPAENAVARRFNIAQYLPRMAQTAPERPAIVCRHQPDARGRTALTFRELDAESDRLAWGFREVGLAETSRTLLMERPGLDFITLTFALFKAGAVPVLIDPGMGFQNLLNCIRQSRPRNMIAIPLAHAARAFLGGETFDSIALNITIGRRWFWGGLTLDHVRMLGNNKPFPMAETRADSPAAILFTSGGTGIPKGVLYEHGMFGAQVDLIREYYGIQPGERDLPAFPLFGLFGAALGTTCVIPEMDPSRPAQCDPEKIVRGIQDNGITYTFGSPSIWKRVGPYCAQRGITFPTVKRILMAGAPVRAEVLEPFTKILPNGDVYIPYGATEALPVANIRGSEVLNETWALTQQGKGYCLGRPLLGITVKIISTIKRFAAPEIWNEGLVRKTNEIGEIVVKGAVVTKEYFEMPKQTAAAKIYELRTNERTSPDSVALADEILRASRPDYKQLGPSPAAQSSGLSPHTYDVWHRMGDMGYFDDAGRLWFCGRKAHRVILRSGKVLYSVCVEAVFENFLSALMNKYVQNKSVVVRASRLQTMRAALAGIGRPGAQEGVIVVEFLDGAAGLDHESIGGELDRWCATEPLAREISGVLWYTKPFPVDVRHNAKINREQLGRWAAAQRRFDWVNPYLFSGPTDPT